MRIFGLEIRKALTPVSGRGGGLWRTIIEPFAGAWQRNRELKVADLTCYPTLYACLSAPSQDIGKLPFALMQRGDGGVYTEVENPAYSPVLRKPNHYQTQQQFREAWILSKLIHGNAFILKGRDARGVVTHLYVLDPRVVMPMISDSGDVFYQVSYSQAENLLPEQYSDKQVTIPASEIVHDRLNTFHHPLIGVPPLCAAYWPVVKNSTILKNQSEFFSNGARPGGILMAPAGITEEDARGIMTSWQENYGGENAGKIAVLGGDLKYQDIGAQSGADSQLVEQMKYSDEQICQAFRIKPYKVGIGSPPGGWKSDDVNVEYHSDALSPLIEAMENLLIEGLNVQRPLEIWLDSEPLWRMDEGKQAEVETKLVQGMVKKPDEARKRMNLPRTPGGDTLWGQHQDYPLGMLADRNDLNPVAPEPVAEPEDEALNTANDEIRRLQAELWQRKALNATREAANA